MFDGPKSLVKALGYFAEAAILAHWLKENKIHHLHIHFLNPAATVVLIAAEMEDFTFSFSVHGPDEFFGINENLLTKKIEEAKFVRCISHFCQSQIMRLLPAEHWDKLHLVRCGISLDNFPLLPEPKNEVPQILCIGRLTKNKGQSILLKALAKIRESGKKFHLTMVGDGEDRMLLEDLTANLGLEQSVTFTGAVGQNKLKYYLGQADLFVLPSFAEGIPIVLMEAMATGIPVISTNVAGIPELIESKKTGYLTFPADQKDLAKKIDYFLNGVNMRTLHRANARQKVEDCYDIAKNGRHLASIFEKEIEIVA